MKSEYVSKISTYLASCEEPQSVESIRIKAGISHWGIALAACLDLTLQGKIKGLKTSRGWVFWAETEGKATEKGGNVLVPK